MPLDIATPSAAGIALRPVPGFPGFFGSRIRDVAPVRLVEPATEAEALAADLQRAGGGVILLVPPSGRPEVAFQFGLLPPAPTTCEIASRIRSRFHNDLRFRKDLFGHLLVEGAVFQRYAERQPRIALEAL